MSDDPMAILSLTGGIRGTDNIELFPLPSVNSDGMYELKFFARAIRHLPKETIELIGKLEKGEQLFLMQDKQNKHDPFALAIRSGDPVVFAGYCPKYYAKDLGNMLNAEGANLEVRVQAVNLDAPLNMRLLCTVTGKSSAGTCGWDLGKDFEPIDDTVPKDWSGLSLELEKSPPI
jgi:hypothetical protein